VAEDPARTGEALRGEWAGFWRFRVVDYRLIAELERDRLIVLMLRIGHRREIYDR
jgi:mRNA interferase RelE/StbE